MEPAPPGSGSSAICDTSHANCSANQRSAATNCATPDSLLSLMCESAWCPSLCPAR